MANASLMCGFRRILGLACSLLCVLSASEVPGKALPVIVAEARLDHFVDRLEALGTLRARETVDLTATVADTITAIHFEDGQRIEAEAILVEMTSDEEHALLEEERSTLEEAKRQFDRVRPLVERGAAAATLLDQRRREYETAGARLRAIESRLQSRLIRAPFAGVVGLRNISVGALIRPGDLITTLDDDSEMKLDFTVPDIFLATLKIGLPVTARAPAFGDRTFRGEVSSISSRIDPTTRAVVVRAILPNPEHLLAPGLLMSVELSKNPREAVVVPEQALIPHGQINRVFVVNPAAVPPLAERREVTIGGRRPGEVEIRSGLKAGEYVVVHGTLRLRPGQEVELAAVDPGGQNLEQLLKRGKGGPAP